jgi:ribA/ribD-fused uncharacterized protein
MSEELVNKVYKVTDGAIHGFFKDHRYLSNFHVCNVVFGGLTYTSSEAAYMAQKTLDKEERKRFTLYTPRTAREEGQKVKLRPNWDSVKDDIMYQVCLAKFTQNADIKEKLLATGDKELVEDNWWHDDYWGRHFGDGKNKLGITLMSVRETFKPTAKVTSF